MKPKIKYLFLYGFILFLSAFSTEATYDSHTSAIIDGRSEAPNARDWSNNQRQRGRGDYSWENNPYQDRNAFPSVNNNDYRYSNDRGYIGSYYFYTVNNVPFNLNDSYPMYYNYPTTVDSYASGFNNWIYPAYPYNGKVYKDQNYYKPKHYTYP